jgi:hypothetical protein
LGRWSFRPSKVHVRIPARELFQIEDGQFRLASLSYDLQDLVRQLATVEIGKLLEYVARIHQLGECLAAEHDPTKQRELIDRMGRTARRGAPRCAAVFPGDSVGSVDRDAEALKAELRRLTAQARELREELRAMLGDHTQRTPDGRTRRSLSLVPATAKPSDATGKSPYARAAALSETDEDCIVRHRR